MTRIRSTTTESEEILLEGYTFINNVTDVSSFTQFEAVVNHLYDSVFVYLNEGTKKDVLQLIWNTLPSEIYGRYYNRNDRWSRDCILEAFRENENCVSDAIEEAIGNLTNCKNIPFVSDAVLIFLTNRQKETLPLSESNEGRLGYLPITSTEAARIMISTSDHKYIKKRPAFKRKYSDNFETFNYQQNKIGLFLRSWYTLISAILVLLALFLVTLHMLYKINLRLNQIPPQQDDNYVNETQHDMNTTKISSGWPELYPDLNVPQMNYPSKTHVVIRNYIEYKNVLSTLTGGQEINLTISIDNHQQWPNDVILNTNDNIVDLSITGAVNTANVLNILSATPKIQSLKIINSFDYLCKSDRAEQLYKYKDMIISLLDLRVVHFEELTECAYFYDKLVKHADINNLHIFKLARAIVTENNLEHIQNFIKMSRGTLESLEFPNTAWNAPIFNYHIGTLHKLQYLHIDFIYMSNRSLFSINKYIDIFFPNLISFTSSFGYLPIAKFQNLSDCKNLKYLKVRILIPESQTEIQLNNLKSFFPQLQNASLYFKFESWESKNECSIQGIHDTMTQVDNIKIRSNCPMTSK